jgi:hypothetical protein
MAAEHVPDPQFSWMYFNIIITLTTTFKNTGSIIDLQVNHLPAHFVEINGMDASAIHNLHHKLSDGSSFSSLAPRLI